MLSHPPDLRRARPRHIHRRVTQFEQLRVFFPSKVPAFRALLTQTRAYAKGRLPSSGSLRPGQAEHYLVDLMSEKELYSLYIKKD